MFWPTILSHRINEESPLWEVRIITVFSRFFWILSLHNTTILFSGLPYFPLASASIWQSCRSMKLKERNSGSRVEAWEWNKPIPVVVLKVEIGFLIGTDISLLKQFKQMNWQIHIYKTNTFINLEKYIFKLEQIHLVIWTNAFGNLDKYILRFGHLANWTN